MPDRPSGRGRRGPVTAALLFVALAVVYNASPAHHLADSRYTLLLSEHLLLHGSFDLAPYFAPGVDSSDDVEVQVNPKTGLPRHLRRRGERLFYLYPAGSAVLSVPLLAGLRAAGLSTIDADGRYSSAGETQLQAIVAALVTALAGVVFFALARRLLAPGWSLAVALTGALGSQLWSVTSRVLWSHTWGVLLLALALYALLWDEDRDDTRHGGSWLGGVLIASALSWAFFVRPTAVAFALPITVYLLVRRRWRAWPFLATGLGWWVAFLVHSHVVYGQWLPGYYLRANLQRPATLGIGLAANLVSPGRGLLVYSPWILLVVWLLVRHRERLRHRGLVVTALAATALHVLIVSGNRNWWAGSCYGPRFTTETVPLWVLLATVAWRAALDADAASGRRWPSAWRTAVAGLLVVTGATLHGAGALSHSWEGWNELPVPLRLQPTRVFAWREAQFLWALDPRRQQEGQKAKQILERSRQGKATP